MNNDTESRLVAIVGGSGAGKSWLAARLQASFPGAARVSQDDFYLDRSHLSPARRASINYDHPRALDWTALRAALTASRQGRAALFPKYDFRNHTRLPERMHLWPTPRLLLVEGLWLLLRPEIRALFHHAIFVECPSPIQLGRRLLRDLAERGRTPATVTAQFRRQVQPMQRRFVEPQKRHAQDILSYPIGDSDLKRVTENIRSLLASKTAGPAPRAQGAYFAHGVGSRPAILLHCL